MINSKNNLRLIDLQDLRTRNRTTTTTPAAIVPMNTLKAITIIAPKQSASFASFNDGQQQRLGTNAAVKLSNSGSAFTVTTAAGYGNSISGGFNSVKITAAC